MVCYGMVWIELVSMVWYGMVWSGMVWHDISCVVCIILHCMEEGAGGGKVGRKERSEKTRTPIRMWGII